MSSPAAKRQRTEDAPTRSEIWHSDGSIVLQADNTQFRVHWGLLALHSSFFRNMQGLPQPPNQPSIDGCPIVVLHDAVVDVEYLLKALYTPTFLGQTALPLGAIAALIRLGRKYDFRSLLDTAVSRLTFENPTTLKEYDALLPETGKYTTTRIVQYPGVFFDVISLARENDILSVLPAAYYRLILNGLDALLDGVPRDDGTLASLAPTDLRRCIRGREKLTHVQLQPGYSCGWYRSWKPGDDCTLEQCTKTLEARLRNYLDNPCLKALSRFKLNNYLNKIQWCPACKHRINELNTAGRQKTWDELPSFFDLPPWNELKNDL